MEKEIFETAEEMLGVDFLNEDLKIMLRRAEQLANNCGGHIRSRQIIASIIVFWENQK